MPDYSPKMTTDERDELAANFLRSLPDDVFKEINAGYPNIINAPEPWFRRHLNAEGKRRAGRPA